MYCTVAGALPATINFMIARRHRGFEKHAWAHILTSVVERFGVPRFRPPTFFRPF